MIYFYHPAFTFNITILPVYFMVLNFDYGIQLSIRLYTRF